MRLRLRISGYLALAAIAGLSTPAAAAVLNAPAVPISQVMTVQPIVVCGNATLASCASTSGLAAYETMANAIYSQAGIGVAFAPLKSFVDPNYLSVKVDNTVAGIFDSAHDLVRLPGHGQATDQHVERGTCIS